MKVERIQNEIDKNKEKITALQDRIRQLEQQKQQEQNKMILATVRQAELTPQELKEFLTLFKTEGANAEKLLIASTKQEDFPYEND